MAFHTIWNVYGIAFARWMNAHWFENKIVWGATSDNPDAADMQDSKFLAMQF